MRVAVRKLTVFSYTIKARSYAGFFMLNDYAYATPMEQPEY